MTIQEMFVDDIDRPINGVIKVDQSTDDVIEQEVREYVITNELKKHFINFFNAYGDAFDTPTADVGVWISGFFGSGKSHFLKMLSYILENREIKGVKTVEQFRTKFENDPGTFMLVDKATQGETDTILFNIDIEGPINKDNTAVLRVFAKMFYNHLGFYGENLKVAKLEQFLERKGKTEEFRRVFEEKNGDNWLESRDAYSFFEDDVVDTLMDVLGMSETAARNWFDGTEEVETSIAQLVSEMKDYVAEKPDNYRMLFMVDEVGQYVGENTNMLLNLQSLIEEIGSKCEGKVWVVCTGQEALDDIIKTRADEFSRIQARFKTRLSLTSSSVDEVIQKRILKKKPEAVAELETVYDETDSIMSNLFTFTDCATDIKGFSSKSQFTKTFPFVPYQFLIMQKVYTEIRRHGNSGKHLSEGERSMLSGFQEAAQRLKDKDKYSIAPFHLLYDTVHGSLDSAIRRVIERCEKAAREKNGIEFQDVDLLKLLYLIRYIDNDIKANINNIVILMANDIRMDKILMKEQVAESLNRLQKENYITRNGECYQFLTDEEQDVQRDIKDTLVDTASVVERVAHIIYGDIYKTKKYKYKIYDFAFDQMVDGVTIGATTGGMKLKFLSQATDLVDKEDMKLLGASTDNMAIVCMAETSYFESIWTALKIRKYVKQKNITELSESMRNIIQNQQSKAAELEKSVIEELENAIVNAKFYVAGERIEIKSGDAASKINQAMEYLVTHVYSELDLLDYNAESDADIIAVLNGSDQGILDEISRNRDAAAKVEEFLEMQHMRKLPTSMADVQKKYSAVPYGWREIDIAAVVAHLIYEQKVTIKYAGNTIQPNDPKLADMLRKKSEIGKTSISKRQIVSVAKMKEVKEFLRDYLDVMDIPDDEDGLIGYIVEIFTKQKEHYGELDVKYGKGNTYPDHALVREAITLMDEVLTQRKDNIALIEQVIRKEDALYENKDKMVHVESFFSSQLALFDSAISFEKDMRVDLDYFVEEEEANQALNQIRLITMVQAGKKFEYRRIPELNGLMDTVRKIHDGMLEAKRNELKEIVRQCMSEIHMAADGDSRVKQVVASADAYYEQRREKMDETESLALLDGMVPAMWTYKDTTSQRIEILLKPVEPKKEPEKMPAPQKKEMPVKKNIKHVHRQGVFPAKCLESEEEIDMYMERVKENLKRLLENCDGIQIS